MLKNFELNRMLGSTSMRPTTIPIELSTKGGAQTNDPMDSNLSSLLTESTSSSAGRGTTRRWRGLREFLFHLNRIQLPSRRFMFSYLQVFNLSSYPHDTRWVEFRDRALRGPCYGPLLKARACMHTMCQRHDNVLFTFVKALIIESRKDPSAPPPLEVGGSSVISLRTFRRIRCEITFSIRGLFLGFWLHIHQKDVIELFRVSEQNGKGLL